MKRFGPALLLVLLMGVALAYVYIPATALHQWSVWFYLRVPGGELNLRYVLERAAIGVGVVLGEVFRNWFSRAEPAAAVGSVVASAAEAVELGDGTVGIPVPVVGETQFLDVVPREAYVPDDYVGDYASPEAASQAAAATLEARIRGDVNYIHDGAELVQRLFVSFFGLHRPEEDEITYVEWPSLEVSSGWLVFDSAATAYYDREVLVTVGRLPPPEQAWAYGSWDLLLVGSVPVRGYAVPYNGRYSGFAYVERVAVPIVVVSSLTSYTGVQYCEGWWQATVVGVYAAWYEATEELNSYGRRRYVLTSIAPYAGAYKLSGVFPHSSGVYGSIILGRLAPHYEMALQEAIFSGRLLRDTWARVCGFSMGVQDTPLPWDVEGAGDFGTAVRQRDAALVWWIVRPLEALREAFVPRISLSQRLENLVGFLADRFPFSVWLALRNYVPPVGETVFSLPCFTIGAYSLCPNEAVVSMLGQASRLGMILLLGLGVVMWLRSRVSVSLRL